MLERLYLNLPRSLQNTALTAFGYKTYRQRYGKTIPEPYNNLQSVFEEMNEQLFQCQQARLSALLRHSVTTVPFYSDLIRTKKIDIEEVTPQNLTEIFPKLDKQSILQDQSRFISTSKSCQYDSISIYTSGSSGSPMRIVSSLEARCINYHYYNLALTQYGLNYRSKSTTFAGRVLYKSCEQKPARYDYYNNTQYLSSYFLSESSAEDYIIALNRWQPLFIDAYPSALFSLAVIAAEKGWNLDFQPKLILTSSETLSELQRNKIEHFFSAPIMDHYGCTEMAISAYSRRGKYYAHPLYSHVELDPLEDGRYSIISTGLLNFAMPLIRYEIGDTVNAETTTNPYCFESIEGRIDDIVITPEGRKIGRLDPAFKAINGLRFAQVVQHSIDELEINVVLTNHNKTQFDEQKLINNFRERTSKKMRIRVSYHHDIARSANGKFKSVISHL
jgi:phenylacetate-CoA ligase